MKTWTRVPNNPSIWTHTLMGIRLVRVPRPDYHGIPTGGWWVLYDKGKVLATFEYRRDMWRRPPLTWANQRLTW